MKEFAIHDGSKILNLIICDSKQKAEKLTGFEAFEIVDPVGIGWIFENGEWLNPNKPEIKFFEAIEEESNDDETLA